MKAKDDNSVKFLYLDENDFKKIVIIDSIEP